MKDDEKTSEGSADPRTSRRGFLRHAGGVLGMGLGARLIGLPAALAAPFGRGAEGSPASGNRPGQEQPGGLVVPLHGRRPTWMERLSHTEFSRQMNTVFMVQAFGASVGLSLVEARDETAGGQRVAPGSECFSLVFRGPVDRPLDQDTYHVEHPRMGAFDLFIVPAWADDGGCYYQAVFNRLPAR